MHEVRGDAYDYKYSDRDVREDSRLGELALAYIKSYGGNFEPLLRIKVEMSRGFEPNVPQLRLILNCMRHDAAVADDLPKPRYPYIVSREGGKVIPMVPRQREPERLPEPEEEPVKYRNRSVFKKDAKVTAKFASGTTGFLVHKATGEGYVNWYPSGRGDGYVVPPVLKVKLVCKNPGWLANPLLFKEEPVEMYRDKDFPRDRCSRCFTVEELREGPTFPKPDLTPLFMPPPEEAS